MEVPSQVQRDSGAPRAHGLAGGVCFRFPGASVPARWTSLQAADIQTPAPTPPSAGAPQPPSIPRCSCPSQPKWEGEGGQFKGRVQPLGSRLLPHERPPLWKGPQDILSALESSRVAHRGPQGGLLKSRLHLRHVPAAGFSVRGFGASLLHPCPLPHFRSMYFTMFL